MRQWCCCTRLGGIGDNLIASSVLPLLARDYEIEVIAQDPWHEVFINNPYISKLTVKQKGDIPEGKAWLEWFNQRSKEYARFYNLSHSCEYLLASLPDQTQFYWPDSFRRKWCNRSYLEMVHDICEVPYDFTVGPRFYPTEMEKARAWQTKERVAGDKKVVGIVLAGTRLDKVWPYFPNIVGRIIEELGAHVIMFGAPGKETEMARSIMDSVKLWRGVEALAYLHSAISPAEPTCDPNKIGQLPANPLWPLRRSLSQLQTCDMVITPDTGPAWAVAMEDMPKAVLLSHASPENITKHWRNTRSFFADPARVPCAPCHRLHSDLTFCKKADEEVPSVACMADIPHKDVFNFVKASLNSQETAEIIRYVPSYSEMSLPRNVRLNSD